jgi:hypothetical protein
MTSRSDNILGRCVLGGPHEPIMVQLVNTTVWKLPPSPPQRPGHRLVEERETFVR